jgi:hypothetical protein
MSEQVIVHYAMINSSLVFDSRYQNCLRDWLYANTGKCELDSLLWPQVKGQAW